MSEIDWNDGIPQDGTWCEAYDAEDERWVYGRFLMKGNVDHAFASGTSECWGKLFWAVDFRPIRTQAQIEAEERDAAINEMIRHVKDHPGGKYGASHVQQLKIQEDACRDLYLAGYRKQGEAK